MGRLTDTPELRKTKNDISVTSFRIAVGRDFGKDETDFFDVTAWRQAAEFVTNYAEKGDWVCVTGRLQNRHWEDKHGQNRTVTEIVAERVYSPFKRPADTAPETPFDDDQAYDDSPFS
jgi:single-strand DNA-binding protein